MSRDHERKAQMDLPPHPLVVHVPVVLIPVSAALLVLAVAIRPLRESLAPVSVVLSALGAAGATAAFLTGEQLTNQLGARPEHEQWGLPTVVSAVALTLVALAWTSAWWRRRGTSQRDTVVTTLLAVGTVVLALTASTFTVLAGHSGAEETWGFLAA
ncbi:hypothetical protein J4H86_18925 [Spiractinospora alimapuensis]|uniref:DUF2231 domain-containing protein n=1 Tax=Spiractinospora alimapuensis TaxID=2820884 RepID=UPI001F2B2401|nr:DUF2231 domain-containing protein [Spiractinospora alimapuensis]QVQ50918.1 hypothetical protein J4H86_18925 [Spiractinospora alimapuensis]